MLTSVDFSEQPDKEMTNVIIVTRVSDASVGSQEDNKNNTNNRHLTRMTVHDVALNPSGTVKYNVSPTLRRSRDVDLVMILHSPCSLSLILIIHTFITRSNPLVPGTTIVECTFFVGAEITPLMLSTPWYQPKIKTRRKNNNTNKQ